MRGSGILLPDVHSIKQVSLGIVAEHFGQQRSPNRWYVREESLSDSGPVSPYLSRGYM